MAKKKFRIKELLAFLGKPVSPSVEAFEEYIAERPFGDLLRETGKLYRDIKRSKDDLSRKPKN